MDGNKMMRLEMLIVDLVNATQEAGFWLGCSQSSPDEEYAVLAQERHDQWLRKQRDLKAKIDAEMVKLREAL